MKKIGQRVYELSPERHRDPLEAVIADISAAHRLGLPFSVETVATEEFRHGGNVTKASVRSYRVTVGALTDEKVKS